MKLNLPKNWSSLKETWNQPELLDLRNFLDSELTAKKIIYPPKELWFNALNYCSPKDTKVVILGQDPYHGAGQAMGLSFSVPESCKIPPSLKNIYKELEADLDTLAPVSGDLTFWAQQGVLLLNNVFTVEHSLAGSHQKKGWEILTKAILKTLNDERDNLVFILWGSPAQKTASFIDEKRHLVLKSVHPSPLSSYRGFFGSRPFSKANKYLKVHNIKPISWS